MLPTVGLCCRKNNEHDTVSFLWKSQASDFTHDNSEMHERQWSRNMLKITCIKLCFLEINDTTLNNVHFYAVLTNAALQYTTVLFYMRVYKIRWQTFTIKCCKFALLLNNKLKGLTTCSFLLQKWVCNRLHSLCRTHQDHSCSTADS